MGDRSKPRRRVGRIADALLLREFRRAPGAVARRLLHVPKRTPGQGPGRRSGYSIHERMPTRGVCVDYSKEPGGWIEEKAFEGAPTADQPVPEGAFRWIDLVGLGDPEGLRAMGERLGLHPLTIDDLFNGLHRPKYEETEAAAFVLLKMIRIDDSTGRAVMEQVGILVFEDLLLTVQEIPGDVFEPVRARLREGRARIRQLGPSYLAYALIDAVVENYYAVLERLGEDLEQLQDGILSGPDNRQVMKLQALREEVLAVRRAVWPVRELAAALQRADSPFIRPETAPFYRDVYDHAIHAMDALDSLRDLLGMALDLHNAGMNNRLNEVIKTLTLISTIFLPLSFLAGIYGMNFEHMPELPWRYSYLAWWVFALCVVALMLGYFRRRGWI